MSSEASTTRRRSRFRPCIDLHAGQVKQIVGGTLTDDANDGRLRTNFIAACVPFAVRPRCTAEVCADIRRATLRDCIEIID